MPEDTKQLAKSSREVKDKNTPIIEPQTGAKKEKIARQPLKPTKCGFAIPNKNSKTKGELNQNLMIFTQIDGSCKMIYQLLNQLKPKTHDVDDCIITHKAWENNNLKHLRGAFA